jgi:hypothetical protein
VPQFLTSILYRGEWTASRSGTHWTGGWVNPRADTDTVGKGEKIFVSVENRTMAVQPVAILTDPGSLY